MNAAKEKTIGPRWAISLNDGRKLFRRDLTGRTNVVACGGQSDLVLIGYESPALSDIKEDERGGTVEVVDLSGRTVCKYATGFPGIDYMAAGSNGEFMLRFEAAMKVLRLTIH